MLISAWSIALLSVLLLATVRSRSIEPLFGGLDRAVRMHRQLGPITVGIILLHVAMYLPPAIQAGRPIGDLLIPFWSPTADSFNASILIALVVWTGFAYLRRLPYEGWLSLHGLFGVIFLGASAHALLEGETVRAFEPLRFWLWLLVLVGAGSWLYRVVLYRQIAPRYRYVVGQARQRSAETLDLVLEPVDRRMIHEPGTFVFVNRPTVGWQPHPFSISSSPTERQLRVSVRMVGDFTRALAKAPPGEPIELFGPFGSFSPHSHAHRRRLVMIGAGIGITPFLGMLRFETTNDDFRRIWLWYVVRNADEAPYDAEIREIVPKADSWVDYELWPTAERGRLTAARVAAEIGPHDDYAVMLCGSLAFIRDMTRQLRQLGVSHDRVIAEDLEFR